MKQEYYIMKSEPDKDLYLSVDGEFTNTLDNYTVYFNETVAIIIVRTLRNISPWQDFQMVLRIR